jgi:hypothetical protein
MQAVVHSLDELLETSSASDEFKHAVREIASGQRAPLIQTAPGTPMIKVFRTVCKLLDEAPDINIRTVNVSGRSGCSDFEGTISINGGETAYAFRWDCHWRASQEKMIDVWGMPDQAKAARQFGYQCFQHFDRVK